MQAGEERLKAIEEFCTSFVPQDVNTEDMKHYAKSLEDDEVSDDLML